MINSIKNFESKNMICDNEIFVKDFDNNLKHVLKCLYRTLLEKKLSEHFLQLYVLNVLTEFTKKI